MKFMVSIRFHTEDPAAIQALVPQEQAHVRELTEQGRIHRLYLAADGSRVWIVMAGESEQEVDESLTSFPLHPYMQTEIVPLR